MTITLIESLTEFSKESVFFDANAAQRSTHFTASIWNRIWSSYRVRVKRRAQDALLNAAQQNEFSRS